VVAIVRPFAPWPECRAIVELVTPNQRLTPAEAHKLLTEQPGALYLIERGRRINLLPARHGDVLFVRTMPDDSPTDPLLALCVQYVE
jgi:hypothetical protein